MGLLTGDNIITSFHQCKGNLFSSSTQVTKRHHPGRLKLLRTSFSHIRKFAPPLAKWDCCGEELPRWDDSWQSRDRKIPFSLVDNGCEPGQYCETEPDDSISISSNDFALLAKPLVLKPKAPKRSPKQSSGPSSGDQTVIIESNKLMNPQEIKFTQNSVLKRFSDPSRPSVLNTMKAILDGNIDIEEFPSIRVATPDNQDSPGRFYTCDHRRLLIFKVLRMEEVFVDWVEWTDEFTSKLRQRIVCDPQTRVKADRDGIDGFRDEFVEHYFEYSIKEQGDFRLYIPQKCAGYLIGTNGQTIRRFCHKYATHINVSALSKHHPVGSLFDIVVITYSEKEDAEIEYVPGKAKREHVKMVRKLLLRN